MVWMTPSRASVDQYIQDFIFTLHWATELLPEVGNLCCLKKQLLKPAPYYAS